MFLNTVHNIEWIHSRFKFIEKKYPRLSLYEFKNRLNFESVQYKHIQIPNTFVCKPVTTPEVS